MRVCNNSTFVQKSKKIHRDKYDYSKTLYTKSNKKIIIICKNHGEFTQTPNKHLCGQGCPKCIYNILTKKTFIEKARKLHGNKYDYSKVIYKNNYTKVTIICRKHGEFSQRPGAHLQQYGCTACAYLKKTKLQSDFIKKARKLYGSKYDYSKVAYKNMKTKVIIICPYHGEFSQTPASHINNHSQCPKCYGKLKISTKEFILRSTIKHDNKYDYSKAKYMGRKHVIKIICPIHGVFVQNAGKHMDGSGCPKCKTKFSKKERKWLEKFGTNIKYNEVIFINNKKFIVDGLDSRAKTIYEFYGDFWHGNPLVFNSSNINPITRTTYGSLYRKTLKRERLLIKAGYRIVSIWEQEYDSNCSY